MPDDLKPTESVTRRQRRHAYALAGAGIVVGLIILAIAANLDRQTSPPSSNGPDRPSTQSSESAPHTRTQSRGWIQITDDQGQLAQQYRCSHLEPNPDGRGAGWLRMRDPEIEVHLSGGTMIAMRSEEAMVHAPNNSVESGELTGQVIIEIFEQTGASDFSADTTLPTTRIRTARASFNSLLGTVVCPEEIRIETQHGEFEGHHLRLWLSDGDAAISNLIVETVHRIRIARAAESPAAPAARRPTAAPYPAAGRADRPRAVPARRTGPATEPLPVRGPNSGGNRTARERRSAPPAPEPPAWYRLRLNRDVRITTGEGTQREQRVTGEDLTILFTLQSADMTTRRPRTTAHMEDPAAPPRRSVASRLFSLVTTAIASSGSASLHSEPPPAPAPLTSAAAGRTIDTPLAPPPEASDIIVRCAGNLVVRPADAHLSLPSDPNATVLEITGRPVLLEAPHDNATAHAARLRYYTSEGRIELDSDDDDEPVRAAHPQFHLECSRLRFTTKEGTGRLFGPGNIRFLRTDDQKETSDLLLVHWNQTVDVTFASDGPDRDGPNLGALQSAVFLGGAEVVSLGGSDNLDLFGSERPEVARLRGRSIHVDFMEGADGQPTLSAISATDDVLVTSEHRILRADRFRATLPHETAQEDPASPSIERVSASGSVHLTLPGGEEIYADALEVDGTRRTAVLTGENVRLLDERNLIDQAQRIEVDDISGLYRIAGRGRFWRFGERVGVEPGDVPGASARQEELRITWQDGATAAPGEDEEGHAVRHVTFEGDVRVLTPDLRLDGADALVVRVRERDGERHASIDRISARGAAVHVRTMTPHGAPQRGPARESIRARELDIDLHETAAAAGMNGQLHPHRLHARGDVHASDAQASMTCRDLEVFFADAADPPSPAGSSDRPTITRATARGDVRLTLEEGELVFADSLEVDAADERAVLLGDPLLVLTPRFMLDEGRSLQIDRTSGQYTIDGPGRLIGFAEALDVASHAADSDAARARRTGEQAARVLEAVWSERVHVTSDSEDETRMDVRGDVRITSESVPRERNVLHGARVVLDFERGDRAPAPETMERGMVLRRLVATHDAHLENRLWDTDDHRNAPRVVLVRGDNVSFDQETLALDVVGAGELLVRASPTEDRDEATRPAAGLSSAGTTLFRWSQRMALRQVIDEQFAIHMHGDVECLSLSPEGTTSTVTAQTLEATVIRPLRDPADEPPSSATGRGLDPGGSMTLRRLQGTGAVFVRTPRRDITCDLFDYNVATETAVLASRPGRAPVSVLTEGVSQPVTAERVVWNLRDDTVTISRGGGGN